MNIAQHHSDQARIKQLEAALENISDRDVIYMSDGEARIYFSDRQYAMECFSNARKALNEKKDQA